MRLLDGIEIEQCDALDALTRLPDKSVDCIITDPPYWTLDRWRKMGTTTRLGGHRDAEKREGWFETIDKGELYEMLCQFHRILPKNGHAWIMSDGQTLGYLLGYIHEGDTGFDYCKPFPVLKRAFSGGYKQGMGYHGRCSHEYLVLCEKGRRRFSDENFPDVFEAIWSGDSHTQNLTPDLKSYPTAKPVSLFARLIELSTKEGERVFDPFAGSGTLGEAAWHLKRNALLWDKSQYAIETMQYRFRDCQQERWTT